MRALLACAFVLMGCLALADDAVFPLALRGFWGGTDGTCNALKASSPANLGADQRWLKIAATDILGTTQARMVRKIPVQVPTGKRAVQSFEFQVADKLGRIGRLDLVEKSRLLEVMVGEGSSRSYVKCADDVN